MIAAESIISTHAYYKKQKQVRLNFLRIDVPKNPHGFTPFSSASLYRKIQTSIPCEMLAKSRLAILLSIYSKSSVGNVTVTYGLFRTMQDVTLRKQINNCNVDNSNAGLNLAGTSKHGKQHTKSESSEERIVCEEPSPGRDGHERTQHTYYGTSDHGMVAGSDGAGTSSDGTGIPTGFGSCAQHPRLLKGVRE